VRNNSIDRLWGITCYFNPVGYRRRLENYHVFRRHLGIPLVTVELSFDGTFQLCNEDADILVQIHGGDVMWQKERLLNIALERVPNTCGNVAWLDCDIVFDSEDWAERANRALDASVVVHLFHERHNLPRHATADDLHCWNARPTSYSVVLKLAAGEAGPEDLFLANAPLERGSTAGLAWAARRQVLEKHRLYDACILGTGDRAMLCAALGKLDYGARTTLMNDRWRRHYLAWARPYSESVMARVGSVGGRLFHLWHGEIEDRQYGERHRRLQAFDFDPLDDIALDRGGCWRWNSDKKAMHAFVRRYFESRNEDGARVVGNIEFPDG
jgi:hypothetical protein